MPLILRKPGGAGATRTPERCSNSKNPTTSSGLFREIVWVGKVGEIPLPPACNVLLHQLRCYSAPVAAVQIFSMKSLNTLF